MYFARLVSSRGGFGFTNRPSTEIENLVRPGTQSQDLDDVTEILLKRYVDWHIVTTQLGDERLQHRRGDLFGGNWKSDVQADRHP